MDYFPENCGAPINDQGDCFHRDISEMEKRRQENGFKRF
jgi:hypothetical protein